MAQHYSIKDFFRQMRLAGSCLPRMTMPDYTPYLHVTEDGYIWWLRVGAIRLSQQWRQEWPIKAKT